MEMRTRRHPNERFLVLAGLGLASAVCVALELFRERHFGNLGFRFLLWNLMLAWIPLLLGVIFAIWQPIAWCAGFFVSEVPFIALLYWNIWLTLRFVETRRGGVLLGTTAAVLFAIRPQLDRKSTRLNSSH